MWETDIVLLYLDLIQVSILASKQGEKSHYYEIGSPYTDIYCTWRLFLPRLFYSVKCYSSLLACFCLTVWILLQFQTVYYFIYYCY